MFRVLTREKASLTRVQHTNSHLIRQKVIQHFHFQSYQLTNTHTFHATYYYHFGEAFVFAKNNFISLLFHSIDVVSAMSPFKLVLSFFLSLSPYCILRIFGSACVCVCLCVCVYACVCVYVCARVCVLLHLHNQEGVKTFNGTTN